MSINRHKPHVLVLPEDDANRQLANGFVQEPSLDPRRIQVLPPAGGWRKTQLRFQDELAREMRRYTQCYAVLLIDSDGNPDRASQIQSEVDGDLSSRVFVLGSLREPEDLRRGGLGTYEQIGTALARDCRDGTGGAWRHELLRHNEPQVARLRKSVRSFLFPQA